MKHRNPIMIIFWSLITLGIYTLVWEVRTESEMNARGAQIPTAWLIIIPLVNYFWLWKFSEGVELVTGNKIGTGVAFCLLFFLGVIGIAIVQDKLNQVAT